jgi:septum formation protein
MGTPPTIVLASASPRRKELLSLAGVPFIVQESGVVEQQAPGEAPQDFTRRAAREKAEAVARTLAPGAWAIGADTTVVVDGQVLGKPADRADAARMLRLLSGRSHEVLTGVALVKAGSPETHSLLAKTVVTFRTLDERMIEGYLRTGEPLDKAGAYGIQGRAAQLIQGIEGSYTNVVGLPLCETIQLLERAGLFRPFGEGRSTP